MDFEFDIQPQAMNFITIDNIGDVCLEISDDEGLFYYLIIKTLAGEVNIATCGPIYPDVDLIPSGFRTTLYKMQYKESKIEAQIKNFLNPPKSKIVQAKVIEFEDACNQFKDLGKYLLDQF